MMKLKKLFFLALSSSIIFSSCSIEKRVYTPGYAIEIKKSKLFHGETELARKENSQSLNLSSTVSTVGMQVPMEKEIKSSSDFIINRSDEMLIASNDVSSGILNREKIEVNKPSQDILKLEKAPETQVAHPSKMNKPKSISGTEKKQEQFGLIGKLIILGVMLFLVAPAVAIAIYTKIKAKI